MNTVTIVIETLTTGTGFNIFTKIWDNFFIYLLKTWEIS